MRLRAFLLAFALLLARPVAALAGDTWCDSDPPVVINLPDGGQVVVYLVDGGGVEHVASLLHPSVTYTTQSVSGGTVANVQVQVVIPDDALDQHFAVRTEVWSGPARTGTLYASQSGWSGQVLPLQFQLGMTSGLAVL